MHTASGSNAQGSAGAFRSSTGAEGAGYRGVGGNQGGVVKTPSGDVYAGRDGNVYQHSTNGWSKWNNGSWQPVSPSASSDAARLQQSRGENLRGSSSATTMDSNSFRQLEQDRQARFGGAAARGSFGRARR